MTSDEFPRHWPGRVIELAKLLGAVSIICGFFGGAWAFTWGPVRDFLDQWERVQVDISKLHKGQQELNNDVRSLKGDDRVIRQREGLSYIEEPVHQGENVTMIMVVARTKLGADCRLLDWTPIFSDELSIPTPGKRAATGPVARQITANETRMRVEMVPPPHLRPGRITVYLALSYQCPGAPNGGVVPDKTDTLAYELVTRGG